MRRNVAILFSLVTTALAYSVTSPNGNTPWTNVGPQFVSWQRVDTDRLNFTIVLTNQNRELLPQDQNLAALVDGTQSNTTVREPSAGWPQVGGSYRINLVQDDQHLSTILAQSQEFNITEPTSSSSATGATIKTGTPSTLANTPSATTNAANTASPSPSDDGGATNTNPPGANSALAVVNPHTGLVAGLALLGLAFA